MNKPVNCRYFYGDYFRGKNVEECRLIEANPENVIGWKRKLCDTCPVPAVLIGSNCRDLELEGTVTKSLFRERVEISFAVCTRHLEQLSDPLDCPLCAAEEAARAQAAR